MKLCAMARPAAKNPASSTPRARSATSPGSSPTSPATRSAPRGLEKIRKAKLDKLPLVRGKPRIGPCVGKVGNFIAIGLNYSDHAAETGMADAEGADHLQQGPELHLRAQRRHRDAEGLDQARLGGRTRHRHRPARALPEQDQVPSTSSPAIASPTTCRSANFQIERGGQWTKGKGCETFGPLGPWLVTKDEIKNPQNLDMWLDVNGESRQNGNTKTMIFGVAHIVWYCSQYFVMEPGDVIITGTPPGVGLGMKPEPKFLKAGDVVKLGIDGLGEQTQKIVKFRK